MNIDLHIERLVLDGFTVAPRERPALQAAVETELAQLLVERGLPSPLATGGALPSVRAGGIRMSNGNDVATLGRQIAQAVYREMGT